MYSLDDRFTIQAGFKSYDDSGIPEGAQTRGVSQVIIHPCFRRMNSDSTSIFDSDVGILKLLEPLEFNENVKPVCLPEASFNPEESGETVKGVVSGWGQTDAGIDNNHFGKILRNTNYW